MNNQNGNSRKLKFALLALAGLTPFLVQAHHLPGESNGFASGLGHPIHGLDHVLAMVAVGLWAAQLGGRAVWLVPAAFVILMTVGGALGMAGIHLPMVETGILTSVLVLGVLIAAAKRLPLVASMAVVGIFALFHGFAHGAEMPVSSSAFSYGLGFVLATALLHAAGVGLGLAMRKRATLPMIRFAGAAITVAGLCLWLA